MTDEQLIYLAREDSRDLTPEAIVLLKEEFARRNLDMNVFIPVEKQKLDEEEREQIEGFYNPATGAEDALLGRNYMSIKNPAQEKELAENEKKFMANLSEEELQQLIRKCDSSMLVNGIIFIAGIVITVATYLAVADKGGTYFVAWGVVIFGGYSFFRAFDAKNKYQAQLKTMQNKKEEWPKGD